MTAAADELREQIREVVRARWQSGMSDVDCQRLATALTKPCNPKLGCDARAGVECYRRGLRGRLEGDAAGPPRGGFHHCRGVAAGLEWGESDMDWIRGGAASNPEATARMHWENTGVDLPGHHQGKAWSPGGGHLDVPSQRQSGDRYSDA